MPPVDIYQTSEHELVLKAELPRPDARGHRHHGRELRADLKGEKKLAAEVKRRAVPPHRTAATGSFSRSFSLPRTVDASKVSAEHKNGVLTVRLPLREEAKPRQIKVDVAA